MRTGRRGGMYSSPVPFTALGSSDTPVSGTTTASSFAISLLIPSVSSFPPFSNVSSEVELTNSTDSAVSGCSVGVDALVLEKVNESSSGVNPYVVSSSLSSSSDVSTLP